MTLMYVFHIPPTHEHYEEDSTLFRFGNPNLNLYLPLASSVGGRYNVLYDAYVCCSMFLFRGNHDLAFPSGTEVLAVLPCMYDH